MFLKMLLKAILVLAGSTPIAMGLLISGILLGKPRPCEDPPTCTARTHGAEVLLLPFGPALSAACAYCLIKLSNPKQRSSETSSHESSRLVPNAHEA